MGEFRRQQSKVWWSEFPEETPTRTSQLLNWGKGVDLSTDLLNKTQDENKDKNDTTCDRTSSSSPSQGSHKSQDSGFSDSELNHGSNNSPQDSPELSKRLESQDDETPKSKFRYSVVEFDDCCNEKQFLETNFDGYDSEKKQKRLSPKQVKTRSLIRTNLIRNKTDDKINQIQNQLELTFKLPKKINSTQNSKLSNVITQYQTKHSSTNIEDRTRTSSLDVTEITGPPVSTSTPKTSRDTRDELLPPFTTTVQRISTSTPTFATVRKLKALSKTKPINLQLKFNSCDALHEQSGTAVKQWLRELGSLYEAEIMTTLQSKSLASDLTRQVTNMAATSSATVTTLNQRTKVISNEFSKLCQHIKVKKYKQVGPLLQSLIGHIREFLTEYVGNNEVVPSTTVPEYQRTNSRETKDDEKQREQLPDVVQTGEEDKSQEKKLEQKVIKTCEELKKLAVSERYEGGQIDQLVTTLGAEFTAMVDLMLQSHIRVLVQVLEEPKTELALRTALSALITLGLEGNHLSTIVAKCGGVRSLLAICLEARATAVRVSSLRALATVCCIAETIRQFEQAGGVEIIADILSDSTRSEGELSEAAAVLAQITAPWVEDNHSVEGLNLFLRPIVGALTRLVKGNTSSETLLLSAAALANLTFMEPPAVWSLLEHRTAGILLAAVRKQGPKVSVFIQEQAATVIANMASVPETRTHLAEQRAVVALLCFLQIRHSPLQRAAEISAAERVQQKSAIALSRLCSDATVARQVVDLQGVYRLVRLCKEERDRNYSDGVLVACLAALRKIVANCGTKSIEELGALELVEPRLLDSFLLYSSRQESYV